MYDDEMMFLILKRPGKPETWNLILPCEKKQVKQTRNKPNKTYTSFPSLRLEHSLFLPGARTVAQPATSETPTYLVPLV